MAHIGAGEALLAEAIVQLARLGQERFDKFIRRPRPETAAVRAHPAGFQDAVHLGDDSLLLLPEEEPATEDDEIERSRLERKSIFINRLHANPRGHARLRNRLGEVVVQVLRAVSACEAHLGTAFGQGQRHAGAVWADFQDVAGISAVFSVYLLRCIWIKRHEMGVYGANQLKIHARNSPFVCIRRS